MLGGDICSHTDVCIVTGKAGKGALKTIVRMEMSASLLSQNDMVVKWTTGPAPGFPHPCLGRRAAL